MGQNAGNFNLSFQQVLETNQLVRSGGKFDPVKRVLRTAPVDQYEHSMANPNENVRQRVWDFRLDAQGRINPELSSGKPHKIHSNCQLPTFVDELIVASCI